MNAAITPRMRVVPTFRRPSGTKRALRSGLLGYGPWLCIALGLPLLGGCATQTLFQSNFGANPINQPPAPVQQVGTANIDGPPGSVVVVTAPSGASGNWVWVSRPNGPALAALQGNLSRFEATAITSSRLTCTFVRERRGAISRAIRTGKQRLRGFLHIDFLPDNASGSTTMPHHLWHLRT